MTVTGRLLAATGFLQLVSIGPARAQAPQDAPTAFVNVNVVPLDRERVETRQTVIVRSDRIVAVGASSSMQIPRGATIIDGSGRYLVPGLTDALVHHETGMPRAPTRPDFGDAPIYLAYGVTTVLNMGGMPGGTATLLEWRKKVDAGVIPGPTLYTAGPFINEPRVNTTDDVERDVVAQKQQGYDFLKYHELPDTTRGHSLGAYRQLAATAHRLEMPLIGHGPVNLGLDELLQARQSIAHVGILASLYFLPPLPRARALVALTLAACALLFFTYASAVVSARRLARRRVRDDEIEAPMRWTGLLSLASGVAFAATVLFFPGWVFAVRLVFAAMSGL